MVSCPKGCKGGIQVRVLVAEVDDVVRPVGTVIVCANCGAEVAPFEPAANEG